MTKKLARDLGAEILEGLREIKRGEVGRVVTFPPEPILPKERETPGLSPPPLS